MLWLVSLRYHLTKFTTRSHSNTARFKGFACISTTNASKHRSNSNEGNSCISLHFFAGKWNMQIIVIIIINIIIITIIIIAIINVHSK
jgi:hypothetical protein